MPKLYRVEHAEGANGMWTETPDGLFVLDRLSDTRLAEMPMPDDESFRLNEEEWKTAVDNMADMSHWFSPQDVREMAAHGFVMLEFQCDEVQVQEHQVLYVARLRHSVREITAEWLKEIEGGPY